MPPITCTGCGRECQRRRLDESTIVYDCPHCDYGERLLRLLPGALYEFAVFGVLELASLSKRLGGWAWRRTTGVVS